MVHDLWLLPPRYRGVTNVKSGKYQSSSTYAEANTVPTLFEFFFLSSFHSSPARGALFDSVGKTPRVRRRWLQRWILPPPPHHPYHVLSASGRLAKIDSIFFPIASALEAAAENYPHRSAVTEQRFGAEWVNIWTMSKQPCASTTDGACYWWCFFFLFPFSYSSGSLPLC